MTDIFGIKFITKVNLPNNSAYGIYAVSGQNSELRFSDAPLTGTPEAYSTGFLGLDGIPKLSESGNFSFGGGSVQYKQITVKIRNTQRLNKILENLNVNLSGLSCIITEFEGIESDSDSISTTIRFTGTVENITFDDLFIYVNIISSKDRLRRSNLMKITDSGVNIPVTFGESDPLNNRFFKAVNYSKVENELTLFDICGQNNSLAYLKLFPCFGAEDESTGYRVSLRLYNIPVNVSLQTITNNLVGKFLLCKEGHSDNVGKYRKILSVLTYTQANEEFQTTEEAYNLNTTINLELSDYYYFIPSGSWSTKSQIISLPPAEDIYINADQAWFEIVDINLQYIIDNISCVGCSNKTVISENVYTVNDEIMELINFKDVDFNIVNNSLFTINQRVFSGNADNIQTFKFLPVTNLSMYDRELVDDLNDLYFDEYDLDFEYMELAKFEPGVFLSMYGLTPEITAGPTITGEDLYNDFLSSTAFVHSVTFTGYPRYIIAFTFSLPDLPDNISFDSVHLIINCKSDCNQTVSKSSVIIAKKGLIGRVEEILNHEFTETGNKNLKINTTPDFYYNDAVSTKNKDFYHNKIEVDKISGYQTLDLNISSRYEYESSREMVLIFKRDDIGAFLSITEATSIYELSIGFKSDLSVSEGFYL